MSKSPPAKKVNLDDNNIEKIAVDYSKPKTVKATGSDQPSTSTTSDEVSNQTIKYKAKREKCKYWDKCYQRNEVHLKEFYHPGDDEGKMQDEIIV